MRSPLQQGRDGGGPLKPAGCVGGVRYGAREALSGLPDQERPSEDAEALQLLQDQKIVLDALAEAEPRVQDNAVPAQPGALRRGQLLLKIEIGRAHV